MKDVSELQSSDANIHHTAEITEHKKSFVYDSLLINVSSLVQYAVIQDDASGQMSQHFFEGTMNEDASDKVQHNTNQSVPDPVTFDTSDSTTSGTISSETREAMDTLIIDLGRLSIPANQLVRDCGLYVATFAEFLSDQLVIPSDTDGYLSSYLRNRYAALLWRYDSDKVKGGYISENDDPPKPKGQFTTPTEEDFVNID
uniref:Ulp1 protease family, C-terminal catalytic domain containing protein n=1 Tax=Solanum tuberosum TaxID=4113 RepID=M1DPD6_SOLTU